MHASTVLQGRSAMCTWLLWLRNSHRWVVLTDNRQHTVQLLAINPLYSWSLAQSMHCTVEAGLNPHTVQLKPGSINPLYSWSLAQSTHCTVEAGLNQPTVQLKPGSINALYSWSWAQSTHCTVEAGLNPRTVVSCQTHVYKFPIIYLKLIFRFNCEDSLCFLLFFSITDFANVPTLYSSTRQCSHSETTSTWISEFFLLLACKWPSISPATLTHVQFQLQKHADSLDHTF